MDDEKLVNEEKTYETGNENQGYEIEKEQFRKLNLGEVTIIDLREKDEFLIGAAKGAINIPFGEIGKELYKIPKEKPVYVYCRTGDWSGEVVEILRDSGYTAYHLAGGYVSYTEYLKDQKREESEEFIIVDASNLRCPGPIVKVADVIRTLKEGQKILVNATEQAFISDITVWCERTGNRLIRLELKGEVIEAVIEKGREEFVPSAGSQENGAAPNNDKTIVVFSGDLDKTIATFIIANGAAAMGRKVTIFFTFWGLNILRKPKRVSVHKTLIERAFGFMMPRGAKKLGLSRMNMGGIGAKMIREIMKSKHVSSLEELIEQAIAHGVRLVACQMSMDIMGIHKEELIDGVELGGVATFLGAGELSDMSLFI